MVRATHRQVVARVQREPVFGRTHQRTRFTVVPGAPRAANLGIRRTGLCAIHVGRRVAEDEPSAGRPTARTDV